MVDIGLTIGISGTVIAIGFLLYRRHINALGAENKAQAAENNALKSANDFLRLGQYSKAREQLSAQRDIFEAERDQFKREIADLRQRGAATQEQLDTANSQLYNANGQLHKVEKTLERLEKDRQMVSERVRRASTDMGGAMPDDPIEGEALRKLRLWCISIAGSPDKTIPDYLFTSTTHGEVAVSQIEQELMVRKGWIEELENGAQIKITEQGRQAAGWTP